MVPPSLCVGRAVDWLVKYQHALSYDRELGRDNRMKAPWGRPSSPAIKLNFDGVYSLRGESNSLGLVARDVIARVKQIGYSHVNINSGSHIGHLS